MLSHEKDNELCFYVVVDHRCCDCFLSIQTLECHNGFFPRAVCIPFLGLLVAILVVDIKRGRRQTTNGETDGDGDGEFSALTARTVKYFGWLVGFGVLIWAIGMVYSIPVYVFSYLKIVGKQSWLKSGLYAAGAVAVIYILFQYVFSVSWPEGALLSMLGL